MNINLKEEFSADFSAPYTRFHLDVLLIILFTFIIRFQKTTGGVIILLATISMIFVHPKDMEK